MVRGAWEEVLGGGRMREIQKKRDFFFHLFQMAESHVRVQICLSSPMVFPRDAHQDKERPFWGYGITRTRHVNVIFTFFELFFMGFSWCLVYLLNTPLHPHQKSSMGNIKDLMVVIILSPRGNTAVVVELHIWCREIGIAT